MVNWSTSLVVKWFTSLAVKWSTSLAIKQFVSLAVKGLVSSVQAHMVCGSFVHCSDRRVCHRACSGVVHLAPSPLPSLYFFSLPLFHQCDGCLEWGLKAGLRGFASHGGSILSRGWLDTVEGPGSPRKPTFHLSKAVG